MSFKAEASIQAEKIRCIIIQCVLTSGLFANRLRCRFYWQQEKVSFRRRRFTHGMFRIFSISSGRSKMTTRLSRSCLYPDRFEKKKGTRKSHFKDVSPWSNIPFHPKFNVLKTVSFVLCRSSQQPCGFNSTFQRNNWPRVCVLVLSFVYTRTYISSSSSSFLPR